ncbi:MAG: Na/Pi symporter [Bacteroidia bacterium]|nr:Na/Pi symporter [Bacteroidia bacterium]
MTAVLLGVLGGLCLFVYAITALSEVLRGMAADRTRIYLSRFTGHLLSSMLTGILITILLGSSSAVIISALVLINARALTFRQSLGIVMGANIGTTMSSQIIALDPGQFAAIPMLLGLVLMIAVPRDAWKQGGKALFYFGLLFFGLLTIESSVEPLKESAQFREWMAGLERPVPGALIGGLVTLIIQSSSATVGMVITLAKQDLVTLPAGIAVLLGAELGTCSDTLIAGMASGREALKTGLFHLVFNLITILLALLFFQPFVSLVAWISGGQEIDQQIANAHVFFNTLGVLLFLPFVGSIRKVFDRLMPDTHGSEAETPVPIETNA